MTLQAAPGNPTLRLQHSAEGWQRAFAFAPLELVLQMPPGPLTAPEITPRFGRRLHLEMGKRKKIRPECRNVCQHLHETPAKVCSCEVSVHGAFGRDTKRIVSTCASRRSEFVSLCELEQLQSL